MCKINCIEELPGLAMRLLFFAYLGNNFLSRNSLQATNPISLEADNLEADFPL